MERKSNGNQTEMERKWNGNGTVENTGTVIEYGNGTVTKESL